MTEEAITVLEDSGIRPTANRITVTRELLRSTSPMSMGELESKLETLDKSSIFRVLTLMLDKGAVHALEDGRGIIKYELCRVHGDGGGDKDLHAHFYCEKCRRVICLEDLSAPVFSLPAGYVVRSVNFMIKGLCPCCCDCQSE